MLKKIKNSYNALIIVGGKWHAFDMAKQLNDKGHLNNIITSFFLSKLTGTGVPKEKIISIPLKMFIEGLLRRLPKFFQNILWSQSLLFNLFEKTAIKRYEHCDICIAWSGFALNILRKAKKDGAITILERGNSHILFQEKVLEDEYKLLGLKNKFQYQTKIIEKELLEYNECDYISIPSLFAKKTFVEKGIPKNKIIHIPYGVDLTEFKQVPKRDNTFRVIHAGSICIRKGVHYLLEAYKELDLINSELLLIGNWDDEMKEYREKYKNYYNWAGFLPQNILHDYYSQGSVFVLNSIEDGFGLVIIQAMACGLPVICTTNTGGEDIIREGVDGFIIPIRDVKKLKEKILFLHKNKNICLKMGQAAKKRAQQFTWEQYGKNLEKEHLRILKNKMSAAKNIKGI